VQDDVVLCELVSSRPRHLLERLLERRIVEHLDASAPVADQVVVMLTARECGLEASDAAAEHDAVDEAEVSELLEDAVHARDPDALAVLPQAVEELLGGEAAVLSLEVRDHLVAGAARSGTRAAELASNVIAPSDAHRAR
jgi:hypothetical protein